MNCNRHQIQLRLIEGRKKCLSTMKKPTVLLLVLIVAVLSYKMRSHFNHSEDIEYLKNSLSKLYQDFDRSMLTDMASMKEFLESAVKSSKNLIELSELRKASQEAGHQIETLQNFEHDKTGRLDLALWNSGGRIAGLGPNTELFYSCNMFMTHMGCPFKRNGPEKLIEPLTHKGEFFRFKGKEASVYIRLFTRAVLDSVTIEHIPIKMSPREEVTSAPRNFSVSGMNNVRKEEIGFFLGNFIFNANKTSIQTFGFPNRASEAHRYVKIDFHDNNGHQNETHVYRVRVHGIMEP